MSDFTIRALEVKYQKHNIKFVPCHDGSVKMFIAPVKDGVRYDYTEPSDFDNYGEKTSLTAHNQELHEPQSRKEHDICAQALACYKDFLERGETATSRSFWFQSIWVEVAFDVNIILSSHQVFVKIRENKSWHSPNPKEILIVEDTLMLIGALRAAGLSVAHHHLHPMFTLPIY